jgi:hypothetical protein
MYLKKKLTMKNILGTGFFIAAIYCLVRSVILSLCTDIWYDELFTMEFSARSVKELIGLTARDVHPPLYYIIVRGFLLAGNALGFVGNGRLGPEMLAKMVSIIPFALVMIYALTTVRKHYGMFAAGMFSFAIITVPQMPEYNTEIRMYSWAMFFVTAALLHGFGIYREYLKTEGKGIDIPDALAMTVFSAAAAYTHYYAALSIGIIYMFLFVLMLAGSVSFGKKADVKAKGHGSLISLVVIMILTGVSYLPWLRVLMSQVGAVKNNYWIQPVGLRSFGSAAEHLFRGYFTNDHVAIATALIMFAIAAALVIRSFIRAAVRKEERAVFEMMAFSVLPVLVTTGIIVSMLLRPVFVNRYMIPAYGAFWLSLCLMADRELDELKSGDRISFPALVAAAMAALVAVVGAVDYRAFIGNEEYRMVNMKETLALFDGISSDTIIISNFDQVQGLFGYYFAGKGDYRIYLYCAEPEQLIKEMVPGLYSIEDPIDIANYLDAGKTVLFLGSFNSREVILEEWNEAYGITYENEGSYLMERYWFDVFRLRK